MGLTNIPLTIYDLTLSRTVQGDFLVDSGAQYTLLPESLWRSLDLKAADEVRVQLADGSIQRRKTSTAWVQYSTRRAATRVILGEADDSPLLGVVSLEELGLILDPLKRTLREQHIFSL